MNLLEVAAKDPSRDLFGFALDSPLRRAEEQDYEPEFEMQTQLDFWNKTLAAKPISDEDLRGEAQPISFSPESDRTMEETESVPAQPESPVAKDIKELLDQESLKDSSDTAISSSAMKRGRRKRKDVVLKTALRKCRKFLQQRLVALTGFVCSKKPKTEDPLVPCLEQLRGEMPQAPESLKIDLFMGALLYPQDTKRNVDRFCRADDDREDLMELIQNVHDVLYKYSHEKLSYFCSVPELAFLFEHYYRSGEAHKESDKGFLSAVEVIHRDCRKTLKEALC
jgi:hypothetical protein